MRKVKYHINDLEWMKQHYKMSGKEFSSIFDGQIPFQAVYSLIGEQNSNKYVLLDIEGNRLNINNLNGYEKGVILNDCNNHFLGKTSVPRGAVSIIEEAI